MACARRICNSDLGGIFLISGLRRQLADEEFLKDVEDGGFANPNSRVFED
jgi:hypothetical protein